MKYKIRKHNLPSIREYLIELDLEFHKEFDMNFCADTMYTGHYLLEFFHDQDALAFELKFEKELYEKN